MAGTRVGVTQLLPYLYLGGELDAANRERLIELNVTGILNCAYPQANNHFISDVNCFSYYSIELYDDGKEDVIKYFKRCWEFLDDMKAEGRVSIIHCKSGNSRAAVMSIGYLMHHLGLNFKNAYYLVKKSRPSINPQEGFLKQLIHYEVFLSRKKELEAEAKKRWRQREEMERAAQRQMDIDMGLIDEEDEEEEMGKGKEKEQETKEEDETEGKEGEEEGDEEGEEDEEEDDEEMEAKRKLFMSQVNKVRSSVPPLVDLIVKKTNPHLATHVTSCLQNDKWEELANTSASLLSVTSYANLLRRAIYLYYKQVAPTVAESLKKQHAGKPAEFIQACNGWVDKQLESIRHAFGTDKKQGLERAFRQALAYLVDACAKQFAGCCSYFITQLEKEKATPEQTSTELEKIILLLCHLHDPQAISVFTSAYANSVAERLIQRNTENVETCEELFVNLLEKHVFDELKQDIQPPFLPFSFGQYVRDLRNMLKDAINSLSTVKSEKKGQSQLAVRVLSSRMWPMAFLSGGPTYSQVSGWRGLDQKHWPIPCTLPPTMLDQWTEYKASYQLSHPRNKLQLLPHLGEAELKVQLEKMTLSVTVSTPMMVVLNLFNDSDELSCRDIIDTTSLGEKQVKQALYCLACAAYSKPTSGGLLKKKSNSDSKLIVEEDVFMVNTNFTSKWRKLSVPSRPYPPRIAPAKNK